MKIFSVNSVTVTRISEKPLRLSIQADGFAATSGWTNPRLDGSVDPNPSDDILVFTFDADRPTGISLPVLTPITAALHVDPQNGVDAVIVSARTNSITIHSSQFGSTKPDPATPVTTLAVGEGGHFTTARIGEEFPPMTTLMVGEESHPTFMAGEGHPTTFFFGEEHPTTLMLGEEGPTTNPQLDDPAGPFGRF